MDMSASSLFASLFVSTVGFAFFIYGKKQQRLPHLIGGIALMIFPYFVSRALPVVGIAAGIIGAVWLAVQQGW